MTAFAFIAPRSSLVASGSLTRFDESEESGSTVVFGRVEHRSSVYAKPGTADGKSFEARGTISTQFVHTTDFWKMTSMALDDERLGHSMPTR